MAEWRSGWALITRPGTKASRLTSTKWNEGSPVGRGNPSSMCICVPRNGIISSVRHWILDPPLSIIVRSEKLAIIYPRHLSVFRASQIIWGPLHRFTELPHLQAFSIAIFLFVRSSRNQIKHLQRFPSRTFEFWILKENYTNIRVFKLVNKERDIDKVWRDWNVYCFEEKKREKIVPSLQFWRLLRFLLL